jgi:hypothetical protein
VREPPNPAAAEEFCRQAWLIRKKLLGPGSHLTLHPFGMLLQSLAAQKKFDEAERLFLDLLQEAKQPKWLGDPAGTLSGTARLLAAAGRTKTVIPMLEHAAIAGFRDVNLLRTDPAFAPLREREDFQKLVKRLEARK